MGRSLGTTGGVILVICTMAAAQTCPRPPADCTGALYCGGEWDFEMGFYFTPHMLAGQCAGPPGGGNVSCVPADKQAHVAVGWSHWAAFPDWPTFGYWGTVSFNENKNCDNVYRGDRSQELTMTFANGVGVIYKQAAVPADHRIRVEAYMKFTPNGPAPDVEHAIGIDPAGGTNPASPDVQWVLWQQQTPSPPQPAGVFNQGIAEAVSLNPLITVFIRQRAFEPAEGQTFMIDHVRLFDLGPSGPNIEMTPIMLDVSAIVETDAPARTLSIRNSGTGTLAYSVTTDVPWMEVSPASGMITTETDILDVTFTTRTMPRNQYGGTITITAAEAGNSPYLVPVSLTITDKPGDLDGDGDVDQEDFAIFQRCYSGPGNPQTSPGCAGTDLDGDGDVDQADFELFHRCTSGPNVPSNPNCLG